MEVVRNQTRVQLGGLNCRNYIPTRKNAKARRRGSRWPLRRFEAGNPTPLLIDQNRRVASADTGPKLGRQPANLFRRFAVAGKKNEADRVGLRKERPLTRP